MKTTNQKKNKGNYKHPAVKVTEVELEGCIAASFILTEPDKDDFNKYNWDEPTADTESDIKFLF